MDMKGTQHAIMMIAGLYHIEMALGVFVFFSSWSLGLRDDE